MANIGDWLQRTEKPLEGKAPFDWHDFSVAQVAHINKEGVQVEFACNCMTFDGSNTKMWYNGEYKSLDKKSYQSHKAAHDAQCPFDKNLELQPV